MQLTALTNGVAERWVGSCRRELLDHVIAISQSHLKRFLSSSSYVEYYLSLPGSPFSLKALNLRRGVVGCNGMFVLLASLLLFLRGCLQTRAALHAENLALRHRLLLLRRVHQNRRLR